MAELVSMNGELFPPDEARISVFDRGFLLGDSVYEVVRTYRGTPFLLDRHVDRLRRSADGLAMAAAVDRLPVAAEVLRAVAAAELAESYIRIIVTRGAGPIGLDLRLAGAANLVIIVTALHPYPDDWYVRGINVAFVPVAQPFRGTGGGAIKAGNYLVNMLALHDATSRGADDGLMVGPDGFLTEGTTSNIFAVRGGRLLTTPLAAGILPGITRELVMELAAAEGLPVSEEDIAADDVSGASELFLTSTIREILPVGSCAGQRIGPAVPGPVTRRLANALRSFVHCPPRYAD